MVVLPWRAASIPPPKLLLGSAGCGKNTLTRYYAVLWLFYLATLQDFFRARAWCSNWISYSGTQPSQALPYVVQSSEKYWVCAYIKYRRLQHRTRIRCGLPSNLRGFPHTPRCPSKPSRPPDSVSWTRILCLTTTRTLKDIVLIKL